MELWMILLGFLIVILTFWDFFHTTISSNGFGLISLHVNKILANIILKINSKTLFDYSGFIHVLVSVLCSFLLLLFGTFLIFASGEYLVVDAVTKTPATIVQRFYYICFLLSTAGFGDLVPGTPLSNFLSAIFSFAGFVLLTTAMAYMISIIKSVLEKKQLALYIYGLGESMDELYTYFTQDDQFTTLTEKCNHLREIINRNTTSFNTFPVIRFFLTRKKKAALVLQLAILYEVLVVIKNQSKHGSISYLRINGVLRSIGFYLQLEEETPLSYSYDENELKKLRTFWKKHDQVYKSDPLKDKAMSNALHKAGWRWNDVYQQ